MMLSLLVFLIPTIVRGMDTGSGNFGTTLTGTVGTLSGGNGVTLSVNNSPSTAAAGTNPAMTIPMPSPSFASSSTLVVTIETTSQAHSQLGSSLPTLTTNTVTSQTTSSVPSSHSGSISSALFTAGVAYSKAGFNAAIVGVAGAIGIVAAL